MKEAIERSAANNALRQKRLDTRFAGRRAGTASGALTSIFGGIEQRGLERERAELEPQLAELETQRNRTMSQAIQNATPEQQAAFATLPRAKQEEIFATRFNRQPKERRVIKDAAGFNRDAATGERIFPDVEGAPKERRVIKDAQGISRFVDTGESVFEGTQPEPKQRKTEKDRFGTLRFVDTGEPAFPEVTGEKKTEEAKQAALVDLPRIEAGAQQSLDLIDKLLKHPGFETSVGAKGFSMAFGAFGEPVAGTDAADFSALFNQIKGKQFLEAFEQLKGAGQITEIEGNKATQAVSRMDLAQSEKEFIDAAREFQGIIRTGLTNAKKAAGLKVKTPPKTTFNTIEEAEAAGLTKGTEITIGGRRAIVE